MEVFSDQYIRIFVELPASSGLILAKQQLPREENVAILSSELHNDHGSKIPGKSTPSPTQTVSPAASAPHGADKRSSECRGRDDRNPKAQETHESSTSSPTLDLSSSSQADATGLLNGYHDSPPLLLLHDKPQSEVLLLPSSCTSSSPNRIVAEVALHETVSDLRWTLLELLPSCFFTNYTLHSHGRRLPEHIPFSSLGLMQGDTLKLVPGLYDERSIRLHLRRFREITGSDNVLLMRELPDPNDPAGPYGSFLKPLILRGENTLDCQADPHPYSLLQLPSDQTTESDSAEEDGSKDEDGEDEEEEEEEEESPRGVSTNGRKVSLQKNVVSVSSKGPKPHKPSRLPQNSKSSSIGPKNTRNAEETSRGNDDTSISPTRQTFLDEDKEETSMKDSSPTETHVGKRGRVDHDSNSCITTSIGSDSRHRARGSPQYHKRSKSKLGSVRGKKDSNARDKKALAEMTRKKRFHLTKLLFQYDGWKGAGCPDDQQHDTRGTEEISMRKIDKKNPHQQQKTRSSKERSSTHGNESRRSLARTVRKECEMLLKSPSTLEIPEKPTCLQSIKPSAFNPPPPARRLQGELSYLEVVTLEGVSLRIICREEGFVVSSLQLDKQKKKETSGHVFRELFPSRRVSLPLDLRCSTNSLRSYPLDSEEGRQFTFHSLSDLLCTYSPMFKDRVISLAPADVDTDLPYHVMPALQTYIHFLASKHQEHYEDEGRVEEYAERGAGLDPWSDERRWGEEVENIREMSVTNLQDQIEFEKQSFKLFVEYQHFALQAAVNVRERRISLTGHPQAHGGSSHCEAPLSTRKDDSFTPTSSSALHLSSDSSNLSSSSAAAATTSSSSSPPSFENRGSVYLSHSSDTAISPAPPATILWNEVAIDLAQPLPLLGEDEEEEDRSFAEETKISSSSDHYVDDKTKKAREERRGGVTPEATDPVKMGQGREDERRTSRRDGWLHKRSHPAALSRSEVKAETHALALLDSLHIFQRPQEQREKEKDDPNAKVEREKPSNGANPRLSCKSSLSSEKKVLLNDWRITAPYSLVVDYAGSRVRCQTTQPLSLLSQGRETAGVSSQIPPDEQQGVRSERRGVGSSSQDQRGDRKTHARSSERITLERPSERTERDRDPEKEEAEEENPYLRLLQDRIGSVLGLKTTAISTAQGKKEERLLYETARCLPFPLEKKVYLLHLGRLSPVDLSEDIYSSARTATSVDAKPSSLRNSLNIREEALPSSSEDYDEDTMGPTEEKNREREKKHESSRRTRERESREAADPREVKLLRPELLSAYMQFRERREKKDFLSSTPLKKETSEDLSRHGDEAHNTTGEKEERIESEDEKKQKENKEEEERRGKTNKKKSKEGKEELASSLLSVDMKKNGTTNRHKTVKGKSPTQTSSSSSSSSSSMERDSDEPARRGSPNSRPNGGGSGLSPNSHEASLPSLYHYHPLQGEGTTATTSSLSTSTSSSSTGGASSSAEENPLEASTKHSVSHPNSSENMSQVLQSHRDKKKTRVNSDKKNRKNDMDEEYKLSSTEKMAVAPCRVEDSERNLTEDEEEEEDVFEAELRYRLELEICRRLPLLPVAFTETYTFYKSNIGLGSIFQKGSCLASGTRERIREAAEQVLVKCLEFTKSQQQAMVVEQRPDYEALRRELLLSKDERPLHSSDIKGEASLHSKEEEESERKKNTSSRKRETDGENSDRVENGGEEIRRKEEDEEEGEERKTGTKKKDEEERRGEKDIMENGVLSDTVVVVGRARGDGKKKRKNERKSTKEEEEQAICERDRGGEEKEKNGEEGIEEFLLTDEDREMMRLLGQDISLLDSSLDLSERSKQMAQQLCHFTFLSSSLSQSTEEEEGDEKEEGRRRQHPSSSPVTWTDGTSQEQLFNLNFHSSSSSFRPYRNGSAKQVLSQTKGKEEGEENENESPLTSLTNGERISASSSSSSASALASSLWSTSSSPCEGGGDGDVILQEASRYLHSVAIPLLGTLLGQHLCSPPLESTSLKDLFHSFGVNLRYLGLVAKYIERHGEAKDSPIHKDDEETKEERKKKKNDFSSFLPLRILHLEMTIRSAVWCFNSFLSHLRFGHLGVATAHLLSCLLCPPDVSYPSQRYPLPSSLSSLLLRRSETRHASGVSRNKLTTTTAINHLSPSSSSSLATKSPSLSQMNDGKERRREEGDQEEEEEALRRLAYLTPDKLWRYIYERIRSHFKYTMPVDRSSSYSCLNTPAGRYVLLRGVCRAVGIQLVAGSSLFHLLGAKSLWERWSVIGCGRGKEETEKVSLPPLVCTQEEEKEERVATRAPHDEEEKEDAQEKIGEVNSSHSHHPSLDHKDTSRSPFNRREETQSTSGHREEEGDSWRSGHDDQHLLKKGERKMCCSASSSAGSVWRPLKSEDIVELFPVLKSDLVVSHLTRHLLAVATHCYVLGWLDAALELYQQVLFVIHQLSGAVCREAALCYGAMGHVLLSLEDFVNAANNFQKALILTERCLGVDHPDTIDLHSGLGRALVHLPGVEYQERGLQHLHRSIWLLRLWTGDAGHPELPMLLVTGARCMLRLYGPAALPHLSYYLDTAVHVAESTKGIHTQLIAEVHSDVSQIYQVTLNYRKALEHCRMARQLLANDPCIEKERVKEIDERLICLTHQAVQAAKKKREGDAQRAQLLQRLRTVVTMKRNPNTSTSTSTTGMPSSSPSHRHRAYHSGSKKKPHPQSSQAAHTMTGEGEEREEGGAKAKSAGGGGVHNPPSSLVV